jgi:NTE family protein
MFGLALSGGGLLGAAHLGVVQALREHGLVPTGYAGTSAGGLVAGLLAAEVPVADIIAAGQAVANDPARFFDVNWRGLLHELPFEEGPPPTGLIQPARFLQQLLGLCPDVTSTRGWKAPCALISLDVVAEEAVAFVHPATILGPTRGRWRIAADRPLAEALRATMALPGLFEGVRTNQSVLVDGGSADTLPADWAYALVQGPILAVNVSPPRHLPPSRIGLWEVFALSEAYGTATESELRARGLPVLVIAPETADIPFFGFRDYGRLITRGRQAVERALPAIEHFLADHGTESAR